MVSQARTGVSGKLTAVLILVIVAAAGVAAYYLSGGSKGSSNVTFALGGAPGPEDAPFYYALQQGYYSSEGLNVTIIPGTTGMSGVSAVSSGEVSFALNYAPALTSSLLTSNITNVKIVAALYGASPLGIIYNEAKVSNASDVFTTTGAALNPSIGSSTRLFLYQAKQVDPNLTPAVYYGNSQAAVDQFLATGQADWAIAGAQDIALLQPATAANGVQLGFISFDQLGIHTVGYVLITSQAMMQEHSGTVRSFVLATLRGMVGAALNPSAAAAAEVHFQPQLNETQMLQGLNIDISCCMNGVTSSTNPLVFGYVDPTRMQQTVDAVVATAGTHRSINATEFYTDAYTQAP